MAYVASDARSRLAGQTAPSPTGPFGSAEYIKFYELEPQIIGEAERTWLGRGQNFVVAYSEVSEGAVLERANQADEYFVLLPDPDTLLEVSTEDGTCEVPGRRVLIVPPGKSRLSVARGGHVVRILTAAAHDLVAASANAAAYASPKPNLPAFQPWPEPPSGRQLRSYDLDVAPQPGRFGRIWRSTNIMVNHSEPRPGPRDTTKMSPHVHADFEQASLLLEGTFVHHIRWPWGTNMQHWRPDEHEICAGPSLAVIPPGAIHTSQQVSQGINQLVDIFAPPRLDFSIMDGWVLNADEYPMPRQNEEE